MAYNQPYYNGGYYPQYQNGAVPDMLNQYKGQYQPMMQPQMVQPMQPTQMSVTNDMLWVLNENEATSYPVAPNNSVVLWDKNKPTIYVKSVNAQGVPSMRVLDFEERNMEALKSSEKTPDKHICKCGERFATKEQLNAVEGKINDILAMYEELKDKQTTKTTKSAKKEVE